MIKLEYIINKLERIKDNPDDDQALKEYNQLIDDLKHDLLVKNCKKTTKASKLSAIKAVLNNKRNVREILRKIKIDGDKMIFTDSYEAYMINKIDDIPFDIVKDEESYPEMKKFFDRQLEEEIQLDYNKIKADIKLKKELMYYNDKINFNNKMLLNMMDILPEGSRYYVYDNTMIIGISPDGEEKGLVLGVKVY